MFVKIRITAQHSLRQDQFVLCGEPEPVEIIAMRDRDFAGVGEEFAAVDPVV